MTGPDPQLFDDWFTGIERLEAFQRGRCAICRRPWDVVDHCHRCGIVRGLLCNSHNTLEGLRDGEPYSGYRANPPALQARVRLLYEDPIRCRALYRSGRCGWCADEAVARIAEDRAAVIAMAMSKLVEAVHGHQRAEREQVPSPMAAPPGALTVAQAAQYLSVKPRMIERFIERGELPGYTDPYVHVFRDDLEALLIPVVPKAADLAEPDDAAA